MRKARATKTGRRGRHAPQAGGCAVRGYPPTDTLFCGYPHLCVTVTALLTVGARARARRITSRGARAGADDCNPIRLASS